MSLRYTASGRLEIAERNVETVCSILSNKQVTFERQGNAVCIQHDQRAETPAELKAEEAFHHLAPYIDKPQALTVYNELIGEYELGFVDGRVRTDETMHVWSRKPKVPKPDELIAGMRARGVAARVIRNKGRKGGRRARVYHVEPGSGGPGCKVTVKRRFWDSYDLLSVPEVCEPLCKKYRIDVNTLRDSLRDAVFGYEVRKPALGNASSDLVFDTLLDVMEDVIDGIRTDIG